MARLLKIKLIPVFLITVECSIGGLMKISHSRNDPSRQLYGLNDAEMERAAMGASIMTCAGCR